MSLDPVHTDLDRPDPEPGGQRVERAAVCAGVEQRREQHVAGDPADAVEVEQPAHGALRAVPRAARAIRAAIVPAPKPSSIPTTARPAAHEQSIAWSAVCPPCAEP